MNTKEPLTEPASGRRYFGWTLALVLTTLLTLTTASANAAKTHLLLETFGSAAQPNFGNLNGMAVDPSTGDLLVIDAQTMTVSRFNPDGTPNNFTALGTNTIDAKGTGKCATVPADCDQTPQNSFTFTPSAGEQQVAVDNSGTATDGNIYVTQGLQAAGNLVDVFASSGEYLGQLTGSGTTKFGTGGGFPFSPCGVAVDASGNLFVGAGFENKVYKFDPVTNPPLSSDLVATYAGSSQICNLVAGAGPSAGSVFAKVLFLSEGNSQLYDILKLSSSGLGLQSVADRAESVILAVDPADGHLYVVDKNSTVREFSVSGASASLISTFASHGSPGGIAVDGTSGRIYAGGGLGGRVEVFGPLVTIPDVTTGAASITGDTAATLNGTVDPDGIAVDECFFKYGPTTAYGQVKSCAESAAEIGTNPKAVHADLAGLTPESLYHYRLFAKNPNATIPGTDKTFRTPGKPAIVGLWSSEVGFREATLKVRVNPENSPTTYRFEWGTGASYGNATAEIALGSDNSDQLVGLALNGLQPGATYHYRVVAGNGIGVSEAPDHTFTTYPPALAPKTDCPNQSFRTGPSAALPDCRAYEMVSPVDKNGGDIKVLVTNLGFPARLEQSSADGGRFAYSSGTAFANAVSAPWTSSYLATRKAGQGWFTDSISPPRQSTSLSERNNVFMWDTQYKAFSADLGEGWLLQDSDTRLDSCAPTGYPNLYRRDTASGSYEALVPFKPLSVPVEGLGLELQGASADGSHAVFRANAKLTKDALGASSFIDYQIYEHIRGEGCGQLRLVSILPNGKPSPPSSSVGTGGGQLGESRSNTVARAVSADGSRIFWSRSSVGTIPGPLYVRVDGKETVLVSAETSQFWTASADGSKAIYSVEDTGSPLNRNLYEFDLAGKSTTLIAEGTKGVVGASEDASRVYFVSDKALEGTAEAGKPNLYLRESGTTRFIAVLSDGDFGIGSHVPFGITGEPIQRGVRVSTDGAHLAFVSNAKLTAYDNNDAADGRPAIELYLYDAETDKLACVSCNPSGSRPAGREIKGTNESRQVAAQLPPAENQLFFPRALSDDGNRLFFESFEALLPPDTNGMADVYEWQRAASVKACEEAGAELYVQSAGGCLSLISSGQTPTDSEFADANPDGSDVFIRTASSLLPQDPGQVDLYDARINGGLPQPPSFPAACEGEACQGPLAAPKRPTPASLAFQGAGNVNEGGASKPRCSKARVRRKGRCIKPRKHAAKNHKVAKRANHERRAGR